MSLLVSAAATQQRCSPGAASLLDRPLFVPAAAAAGDALMRGSRVLKPPPQPPQPPAFSPWLSSAPPPPPPALPRHFPSPRLSLRFPLFPLRPDTSPVSSSLSTSHPAIITSSSSSSSSACASYSSTRHLSCAAAPGSFFFLNFPSFLPSFCLSSTLKPQRPSRSLRLLGWRPFAQSNC